MSYNDLVFKKCFERRYCYVSLYFKIIFVITLFKYQHTYTNHTYEMMLTVYIIHNYRGLHSMQQKYY